ncbi:hypothetical protein A2U01_0055124, partial [Trifolium medium]|nr:hypothetical protein [Trifolium medium]
MRLLETALVLNDERGNSSKDLEKMKIRNEKLEAEAKELREMQAALGKAKKELEELKASSAEEKKNLEVELGNLKSAMAPAKDEPASARGACY